MLGGKLSERFGLLEKLEDDLGFERGSVRLFRTTILLNSVRLTVQIPGSTILCWYLKLTGCRGQPGIMRALMP